VKRILVQETASTHSERYLRNGRSLPGIRGLHFRGVCLHAGGCPVSFGRVTHVRSVSFDLRALEVRGESGVVKDQIV
jgi:hypothetical protein